MGYFAPKSNLNDVMIIRILLAALKHPNYESSPIVLIKLAHLQLRRVTNVGHIHVYLLPLLGLLQCHHYQHQRHNLVAQSNALDRTP
jgi:hypothetical protein